MAKRKTGLILKQGSGGTKLAVMSRGVVQTKKGAMRKTSAWVGGDAGAATLGSTPAQSISQSPLFYDYRYSTPDKFYFPRDRAMANSIWRDIYRRDATVAIATDMYSELPWSKFTLEGIDDGSVRKLYEDMFNALNLVPKFTPFTKDYLITGELILHAMFNTTKGYWQKVISHNPDYIRVVGTGLAFDQPLMWMKATPEIKRLLASVDPRVRKVVDILPRDMVNAFRGNREVPLEPLNTTFLPRLNTSQEVRGTSIYTRLFRVNMYEDFTVNCSLAVSQRNAAPVRLIKVGDPNPGGWKPSSSDLESLAEMFSLAESDPFAAILTHPWVTVEYVGVSDKALLISREWDFIERVKLLALGVAKAFLVGETSFACFERGTPVHLANGVPVPVEDVATGDLVLDHTGKPAKVTNVWCEGVPEKLLEIRTWGGRKFRVTHNHRFPAWMWPTECACGCKQKITTTGRAFIRDHVWKASGMRASGPAGMVHADAAHRSVPCEARIYEGRHPINTLPEGYDPHRTVRADQLRKGDYLKIPITSCAAETNGVTPELARLVGYYLAEGSMAYSSPTPSEMRLTFGRHERDTWVKDVEHICRKLGLRFALGEWKCHGKLKNAITARVIPKDKSLLTWIVAQAGERAHSKVLSTELLHWPEELLRELIRGYFRGDGSRKDKPCPAMRRNPRGPKSLAVIQVGTVSEKLASQMVLLLARLGFPAGHAVAKVKPPRKPYHILRVGGKAAKELAQLVWSEDLQAQTTSGVVWCDEEYMYIPITSVKEVPNTEPVYNLEVEGNHTYLVCDGLATHNSAVAGLQTLLQRLSSLREMFEQEWMVRKLCEPIAKMHEFYERPKSQLEHRIRVERPEDRRLIVPKIKWAKSLDSTQDANILNIWQQLNEKGIISDRTLASGAGVDLEVERRNRDEEQKYKEKHPAPEGAPGGELGGGAPEAIGPPGASLRRRNPYCIGAESRALVRANREVAALSAEQLQTLARVESMFAAESDTVLTGDRP